MIALLIHAHKHPDQVARLVSRLRHPEVCIFINVDRKIDIKPFEDNIHDVHFLRKRVEVSWGRFSQVQQILNSFQEIISLGKTYSHILFISGQDYPIRPIVEIVAFLNKNIDNSFIDYHKLGDDDWSNLIKKRYEYWFFLPNSDIRNNSFVKRVLSRIGFKRRYPFKEVYYGSCWFCLSLQVVRYILKYTDENPETIRFFEHTGCSDELFIQSLLLQSPFKDTLINKVYRYFNWNQQGKNPKILTVSDLDSIRKSNAWFARKLDIEIDYKLFDALDKVNE